MPQPPLSESKRARIVKGLEEGKSHRQIAKQVGVSVGAVSAVRNGKRLTGSSPTGRSDDIRGDTWTISLPRTRIHTLEHLLEFCEVDTRVWEVDRFICNAWEMGYKDKSSTAHTQSLYQVKAWLKKKVLVAAILSEIEDLKKRAAKYSPKLPAIIRARHKSGGVWVEHAVYDHHFGSLIWAKETGHDDYDSAIAKRCWEKALSANMARTDQHKPEGALFVIGNDLMNVDNRSASTERGTPQSTDTRYQKMYEIARDSSIWAIDQMVARYGRVHVPVVRGNHDPLASWHLGDYLTAWYHNNKNVTIDNAPNFRKWWEWGVNMLMFTHGNSGKLEDYGKTMAAEQPAMWGRTLWRETHSGDKHQRRLIEQPGCTVRILPSLRPPCAWSAENMYDSIRAAESYVWSASDGLIATANFCILPGQSIAA